MAFDVFFLEDVGGGEDGGGEEEEEGGEMEMHFEVLRGGFGKGLGDGVERGWGGDVGVRKEVYIGVLVEWKESRGLDSTPCAVERGDSHTQTRGCGSLTV